MSLQSEKAGNTKRMDGKQIIALYEAILATTSQMLIAAQKNEWEKLVVLEQTCKKFTEELARNNPEPVLSDVLQQRKIKIIHQVLDDDAQIRALTEPWMNNLQNFLDSAGHRRNLQQAYQSDNSILR